MSILRLTYIGLLLVGSYASAGVTPTTYDPATATGELQLSDGNLRTTVTGVEQAFSGGVRSVHSVSSGKYYWEVTLLCPAGSDVFDSAGLSAGVVAPDVPLTWGDYFHQAASARVWGFLTDGPDAHHAGTFRRLFGNTGNMLDGDVVRLALDMDAGYLWLGRNDQWADGDPASGLNPTFSGLPGELYAAMMAQSRECSAPPNYLAALTNFGPTFEYPVPDGFNAGFGPIQLDVNAVTIDIKPGSYPNSINPRSKGKIPVAILATDAFDATQVDFETVVFGPGGATESHGRSHVEDVDGDGDMDLALHFNIQDTGITCGDTEATLTGETFDGQAITGTDSIVTVGCPSLDGTTISVLVGDKDCFGLGGSCSDGDHYFRDLGGTGSDNREPGEPLGVDQFGTSVPLRGPSFSLELDLGGATPLSASLTTFTAGIDLVGATFFLNGTDIGFYVEPDGLENRAATVVFNVPIALLTTQNTLTLSVPDLGLVQDGFIIDYVELSVETDTAGL